MRLNHIFVGILPACLLVALAPPSDAARQQSTTSAGAQAPTNSRGLRARGPGSPQPLAGLPKRTARPGGRSAAGPPPPNDTCAAAAPLAATGVFAFDNAAANTDGPDACTAVGQAGIDRDLWYCWTAPESGEYAFFTCGLTGLDTKLAVYSGCGTCPPGAASLLACNDDTCDLQSAVSFNAIQGQPYLLRVGVFPGAAGGAGEFALQAACQTGASCQVSGATDQGLIAFLADEVSGIARVADNFRTTQSGTLRDVCWYGAYSDVLGGDCTSVDDFTITYYADDAGGFVPGTRIAGPFQPVVSRVPTGELVQTTQGDLTEYLYQASHAPVDVLAGTCLWIEITNDTAPDDCSWFWASSPGGDGLFYQVGLGADGTELGDLAFCVDVPFTPGGCQEVASDTCGTALPITGVGNFPFNLVRATSAAAQGCAMDNDVWFCWESVCTGQVTLTTCDLTSVDTKLAVYEGCGCPVDAGTAICEDDSCGPQTTLTFDAVEGQSYMIRVGAAPGTLPGVGLLNVLCDCPAINQVVPGSLIVWPEFQNSGGKRTVLTVSTVNCLDDVQGSDDVNIHMVFKSALNCEAAGFAPPCCQEFNFDFDMTACDSYTLIIDSAVVSSGAFPEGFVYAYARRPVDEVPITFNHLIADTVIVDGLNGSMYRVKPYLFRGLGQPGQPTDDPVNGVGDGDTLLELNGIEYQPVADEFIVPRVLGARPAMAGVLGIENELVLLSLTGPPTGVTTVRSFIHLDDDPGVDRERQFRFRCWERFELDVLEAVDFAGNLNPVAFDGQGRQAGWMRVDGELFSQPGQPDVQDPAFLMLFVERQFDVGGRVMESASRPFELCTQTNGDNLRAIQ